MRQIVLDTETTGLEPKEGHRIIEIGAVELIDRKLTGRRYHQYLWPDREIDEGALEVHGISLEFLKDSPRFGDIVEQLLAFFETAELIIHNAAFDLGFINHELQLLGSQWGRVEDRCAVVDTLALARELHPGQKNNLDALCKRYQVDNSQRTLHGALLDAEILADVYLAMTGGQVALSLELQESPLTSRREDAPASPRSRPSHLVTLLPTAEELQAHAERLAVIDKASGGRCAWKRLYETPEESNTLH